MRINTNVSALTALGNLNKVQDNVASSMQKLSSGFRINKAGDDAAGLGISNQMGADIKAMTQASRNAEQAGSVLQIMDGATSNIQTILERMKELAAQSASDTVDAPARTKINSEFASLSSELDRISATTKFQGASLLDGTFGSKTTNLTTVKSTSSLLTSANMKTPTVTSGTTFAAITGDVTASVVFKDNALDASFKTSADATIALTAADQTKIDKIDASSSISLGVVQGDATATADATGEGSPSDAILGDVTVLDQSATKALKAGAWTISTAANSDGVTKDITFTNGSDTLTATAVADDAAKIDTDGGEMSIALSGTVKQADLANLDGATLNITQNYTISASGGGVSGGDSQAIVDDGTAPTTVDFSGTYGFSFSVDAGAASTFDGQAIGVTKESALKLTSGSTTQTSTTALSNDGASQTLAFSTFGLSIVTGDAATAANLTTDFAANKNVIKHDTAQSAQFLVSSSQSYTQNDLINLDAVNLTVAKLGLANVDLTTAAGAQGALATIDSAIDKVGTALGDIGAAENRVTYANTNVKTTIQNLTAAQSAIKDVDMAQEMTTFSKNQILSQASTAMLAQANQLGQSVLKLLQ
jgi:flagellin